MPQNAMEVNSFSASSISSYTQSSVKTSSASQPNSKKTSFSDVLTKSADSSSQKDDVRQTEKVAADNPGDVDETVASPEPDLEEKNVIQTEENIQAGNSQVNAEESSQVNTDVASQVNADGMMDAVGKVLDNLKGKIADILGVDEEELEKMMAESGISVMDLLQTDSLKQLLFTANNVQDGSELLTNESLLNDFKLLSDAAGSAEQQLADFNIDIQDILKDDNFGKVLAENVKVTESTDVSPNILKPEAADSTSSPETVQQPVIIVDKEVNTSGKEDTGSQNSQKKDRDQVQDSNTSLNQFVNQLAESAESVNASEKASFSRLEEMREIVNQVVEQIKVKISTDSTSMEMQLNPEQLGKVHVSVVLKSGQMTATFMVENQLAKEALESQMVTLKDNLSSQGLKIDAVEVTVSPHSFDQNSFSEQQNSFNNPSKKNSHSGRTKIENESSETQESENAESILPQGGTVDYSA